MAEASQENTTFDRRTRIDLVKRIFWLIKNNSLAGIRQIFETLQPKQRTEVLNTSIRGFIPLYVAIDNNQVKIFHYLFVLSLKSGIGKMSEHWKNCRHPFVSAIHLGNKKIIEQILQKLPDINDTINGAHTPLMSATLLGKIDTVKLIVRKGADINRPCLQGRTPLMESTPNTDICKYLLGMGANVNQQDKEGYTALHLAVAWKHKGSLDCLLRKGVDCRIRNYEGINPLMWAALSSNRLAFLDLLRKPIYSISDRAEAMEIMNASYVIARNLNVKPWKDALFLRKQHNLPKYCRVAASEILEFSIEFTTEADLENVQGNLLRFAFQSILVVERILGRNNRFYLQLHLETALIAKERNNTEKVRQFIDYIQEYCRKIPVAYIADNLCSFKTLFWEIAKDSDAKNFFEDGGFVIFKTIAQATVRTWNQGKDNVYQNPYFVDKHYSEIVSTFLYMTSKAKKQYFSEEQVILFKAVVREVVREDPRIRLHRSILHHALKLMKTPPWDALELIEILLESGADPNSKDCFRRTPIMCALNHVPAYILCDVLVLLLEYGGHEDSRNDEGLTALDDAPWRSIVTPKAPRSLQCLATEVVLDNEISYEGIVSAYTKDFINLHS